LNGAAIVDGVGQLFGKLSGRDHDGEDPLLMPSPQPASAEFGLYFRSFG